MSARDSRWREQVTASADSSSVPVFFPRRISLVTVKAIPGAGGTALVKFTLDDPDTVHGDPDNANWEDWEPGAVSESTSRAMTGAVTALRIEATGESAVM